MSDGINAIEAAATAEGRDLSDTEQADLDKLYARAATLKPETEAEAAKVGSIDAAAVVLAHIAPKQQLVRRAAAGAGGASGGVAGGAGVSQAANSAPVGPGVAVVALRRGSAAQAGTAERVAAAGAQCSTEAPTVRQAERAAP